MSKLATLRPTRPASTIALVVMLLAALIAAGCSSGADDDVTTAAPSTTVETSDQQTDDTGMGTDGDGTDCANVDTGELEWDDAPDMQLDQSASYTATLTTEQGDVAIELLVDEAPVAVNNFVFLARNCFYTDVPVHRIVEGFVIQSGDPTGTGTGGPGYTIEDEDVSLDYERGTVAMARTPEPNSAGSQFFISLTDLTAQFPGREYVIFGRVTEGMEIVDEIAATPVETSPSGEESSPVEDVTIDQVTIEEHAAAADE